MTTVGALRQGGFALRARLDISAWLRALLCLYGTLDPARDLKRREDTERDRLVFPSDLIEFTVSGQVDAAILRWHTTTG